MIINITKPKKKDTSVKFPYLAEVASGGSWDGAIVLVSSHRQTTTAAGMVIKPTPAMGEYSVGYVSTALCQVSILKPMPQGTIVSFEQE